MSSVEVGSVAAVGDDGAVEISLTARTYLAPGTRLAVLRADGSVLAEVKVIQSDESGTIARQFEGFVADDQLRRAATTGAGAGIGAAVGSLVLEPMLGAIIGAALGTLLTNRSRVIKAGQKVVSVVPELEAG